MISQTSEYALRAVVHLARLGGGPSVTREIAEATRVPSGYLSKVLRQLTKAGVLTAQRGIGGGFALARPAGDISILDVLRASDEVGVGRINECPLGIPGHTSLCALHRMLDEAIAEVERRFGETTIQDILVSTRFSTPLCDLGGLTDPRGGKGG